MMCLDADKVEQWLGKERTGVKERWKANSAVNSVSVVIAGNAVVATGEPGDSSDIKVPLGPAAWTVQAFDINDGNLLWVKALPSAPVAGGLCVDGDGRVFVVLEGGKLVCFSQRPQGN